MAGGKGTEVEHQAETHGERAGRGRSPSCRVRLLGRPGVSWGEGAGEAWQLPPLDKGTAILFYLAFRGDWVPRREVLFLLWPDIEDKRAQLNLRQHLLRLRKLDWAEGFETERTRLRWAPATDLERFRAASSRSSWQEAVDQVSGPLLEGFALDDAPEFESWLAAERQAVHERFRQAVFALTTAPVPSDYPQTIALLDRLLEQDPFDEEVLRRRLSVHAAVGDRAGLERALAGYRRRLEEELGVEPAPETLELAERLLAADGEAGPHPPPAGPRSLPVPGTPFIGRERERAELEGRLLTPDCRLLTLAGPGGSGKTRLALALAEGVRDAFADGAAFVPLADVEREDGMVAAVTAALGVALLGPGDRRRQLLHVLAERELLLVLDNLEQLPAAAFVLDLLEAAPGVTVVATTRSRLSLRNEHVHVVAGLACAPEGPPDPQPSDAARLFLERAGRLAPGLEPDLPAVERICRLVGGMPLAIELAAGWADTLPVEAIGDEIARDLGLLEDGPLDLPPRQRSVRAVFDVSWSHLEEGQREALRRLSVFRGGFDLEGARVVAETPPAILRTLVRTSWLQRAGSRFALHPLVSRYLAEQAAGDPDDLALRERRHGRFVARLLGSRERAMKGRGQEEALAAIERDLENVRAFWRRAGEHGWYQEAAEAAEASQTFFDYSARWNERDEIFRAFVARVEAAGDRGPLARLAVARVRMHASFDLDELRECLSELRDIGTDADLARVHAKLAMGRVGAPLRKARDHREQARSLYRQLRDPQGEADAERRFWETLVAHGLHDEAFACATGEIRLAEEAGDMLHAAHADIRRLESLLHQGRADEAGRLRPGARQRLRQVADLPPKDFLASEWFRNLMLLAALEGRPQRALRHLRCHLEASRRIGHPRYFEAFTRAAVLNDLELHRQAGHHARTFLDAEPEGEDRIRGLLQLARSELGLGRTAEARPLLRRALTEEQPSGSTELSLVTAELARAEGRPADAASLAAAVCERKGIFILHRRRAKRLLEDLRTELGDEFHERAVERGRVFSDEDLRAETERLLAVPDPSDGDPTRTQRSSDLDPTET